MADDLQRLTLLTEAESGDLQPVLRVLKLLLDLSQEARETAEDLDRLGGESREAGGDLGRFGDDAQRAATDTGKLDRQIEELASTLAQAERKVGGLESELADLRQKLKAAGNAADGFGGGFKGASEVLTGFTRRIGEIALDKLIEGLRAGAVAVIDFDETMRQVQGLTSATEEQFLSLAGAAQELGKTTRFSAAEAASAQRELAKAGFEVGEILTAVGSTLTLAQVGMVGMAEAAGIAAVQARAFGGDAEDLPLFVDQLALAASNANTNLPDLAEALSKVAGTAVAFNESMGSNAQSATELQGEMLTLLQVLADSGKTGEEAGTALRMLFGQLIQLRDGTATSREALEKLGLTAEDLNPAAVGLTGAIENLAEGNRRAGDAFDLVGARAADALQILAQNADKVRENQAAMAEAEGTAKELAAIFDDTLRVAMLSVVSALQNLAIEFAKGGGADAMRTSLDILIKALRDLGPGFEALGKVAGVSMAVVNSAFAIGVHQATAFGFKIEEVMEGARDDLGFFAEVAGAAMKAFGVESGEALLEFGRNYRNGAAEAARDAGKRIKESAQKTGEILRQIWGEDVPAIFRDAEERQKDLSEAYRESAQEIEDSSGQVAAAAEEVARAVKESGEGSAEAGEKLRQLGDDATEMAERVIAGLREIADAEELARFSAESENELRKVIEAFHALDEDVPPIVVEALSRVSDAFDELPEKVGASLEAVREKAVELSAGFRAAMAEGFETPEELEAFADGVRPQIEELLDAFAELGEEAPPHLQEVAKAVDALPEGLRQVRDEVQAILDEFISPEQIETQTEVIATAFEKISARTPQVKERFRDLTESLVADAQAAGVAVPASIKAIRDELGLTAEAAEAAKETILSAFEGLAGAVDFTGPGQAEQIRAYFSELIMGSDEMLAAFQALEDSDAVKLKSLIQGLEQAAAEGSLTEDRLKATEEEIQALLQSAGQTSSVDAFNAAMSNVGGGAQTAAAGMQQATDATKRATVEYDAASKSVRQTAEATKEAGEAASGSSVQWNAATQTIEQVKQAAEEVGEAAGRAGDGIAEAGEKAGEAAGDIGVLAEGAQEAAAAQEEMGTQASAIAEALGPLGELLEKVAGADISALVTQLGEGADALVAIGQNADNLAGSLGAAADEAARLAENLDAVDAGESGGEG